LRIEGYGVMENIYDLSQYEKVKKISKGMSGDEKYRVEKNRVACAAMS